MSHRRWDLRLIYNMQSSSQKEPKYIRVLCWLGLLLVLLLPRAFNLDHFVTSDESRWLIRSGNFLYALQNGELAQTFQHGHPGVTVMWLGSMGYRWAYPDYVQDAPSQFGWKDDAYEAFIESQGRDPLNLLAAGRLMMVLANVVVLGCGFWIWQRVVGLWAAMLGFVLVGLDPLEVGFARFLHPDGLLFGLMTLAVVGVIGFSWEAREGGRNRFGYLVVSAVAAGLAWLTKTPGLFLLPFCGVVLLAGEVNAARTHGPAAQSDNHPSGASATKGHWFDLLGAAAQQSTVQFGLWIGVAVLVFVIGWPAMWVAPLETMSKVLDISVGYAAGGHDNPIYFGGQTFFGNPGWTFYPISAWWRITPPVLMGVGLSLLVGIVGLIRTRLMPIEDRLSLHHLYRFEILLVLLAGFVLLFGLFMTLGAKKFDRYLLPAYPALALMAGLGWANAGSIVGLFFSPSVRPTILTCLGLLVVGIQALVALPHFPYYISYYNPLGGGGEAAKSALTIGWGEGMGGAARFLNQVQEESPNTDLRVASWHRRSPFSYFFTGESIPLAFFWRADYAVFYASQQQRQLPARQVNAFFAQQTPTKRITLGGTDYVDIYKLDTLLERFGFAWQLDGASVIELVSYSLFPGIIEPGTEHELILHLVNRSPIDKNLNLLVRVIDQAGWELYRSDQWPFGAATKDWQIGQLWLDKQVLPIPVDAPHGLYRVEVSFYDPSNLAPLSAVSLKNDEPVGETVILDYLTIGRPKVPQLAEQNRRQSATHMWSAESPAIIGDFIELHSVLLSDASTSTEGKHMASSDLSYAAGDRIHIQLWWQIVDYSQPNLKTFVHLVGPSGTLDAQIDQPPLGGIVPTFMWTPSLATSDEYLLNLPDSLKPGGYQVLIGMYNSQTLQRLSISQPRKPDGDALLVATIQIE